MNFVYSVSSHAKLCHALWQYICEIGVCISFPCILIGDVNQTLMVEDKSGGCEGSWRRSALLWDTLNACDFIDLRFLGQRFTWTNNREVDVETNEHIDWAWGPDVAGICLKGYSSPSPSYLFGLSFFTCSICAEVDISFIHKLFKINFLKQNRPYF